MDEWYEEPIPDVTEETEAPSEELPAEESLEDEVTEPTREELEEELQRLSAQLSELQQELESKEAEHARVMAELEEFQSLFPHVAIKEIPESVYRQVAEGVPLSAAYALHEKKTQAEEARAALINQRNAARSAGRAGTDGAAEYFSPDEVRAMSQRQVHENYNKILESMRSWI